MAMADFQHDALTARLPDGIPPSYDLVWLGGKHAAFVWIQRGEDGSGSVVARIGNAATGDWNAPVTLISAEALGAVGVGAHDGAIQLDWVEGRDETAERAVRFQSFDRTGIATGPSTDMAIAFPGAVSGLRLDDGGFAVAATTYEDIDSFSYRYQNVTRLQLFDATGAAAGPAAEVFSANNDHDYRPYLFGPGLRETPEGWIEVITELDGDDLEWSGASPSYVVRVDPDTGETTNALRLLAEAPFRPGVGVGVQALESGDGVTLYAYTGHREGSFIEAARLQDGELVSLGAHDSPFQLRAVAAQDVAKVRLVDTDAGAVVITQVKFSGRERGAILASRHGPEGEQIGDAIWLRRPDGPGVSDVEAVSNGRFLLVTWSEAGPEGANVIQSRLLPADLSPLYDPAAGAGTDSAGYDWSDRAYLGGGDDTYSGGLGHDEAFGGAGNDRIDGEWHDDTLHGEAGDDTLIGADGNDLLDGGPGADDMRGGPGDDTYRVDAPADIIEEAPDGGFDTIVASIDFTLGNLEIEAIVLDGEADLNATGNGRAQAITGNAGANTLSGGGGDDTLTGGAGADTFMFRPGRAAVTVTDFDPAEGDKLALADRFFGLGAATVDLRPVTKAQAQAALRAGDVTYDPESGALHITRTAEAEPELVALLEPGTTFTYDDVLLF